MKTLLTYFLNVAVLSFTMNAYSQSGINKCYGFDCWQKKWSVSVFTGSSLMGPGKGIEEAMNASGLKDNRPDDEGLNGMLIKDVVLIVPLRLSFPMRYWAFAIRNDMPGWKKEIK